MTLPARAPLGVGVTDAATAEVDTADGGVTEAAESPPDPQALTDPATAAITTAPKAFRPESVIRFRIMTQCAKEQGQFGRNNLKALLGAGPRSPQRFSPPVPPTSLSPKSP